MGYGAFEDLAAALGNAVPSATYSVAEFGELDFERYRDWIRDDASPGHPTLIESASAELDSGADAALQGTLVSILDEFIDDGKVGVGFINDGNWSIVASISKFAAMCTVAAARSCPDDVAERIIAWANGGPVRFRNCAIIGGVSIAEALPIGDGKQIQPLPSPTTLNPQSTPLRVTRMFGDYHLNGATKLTIARTFEGPFFKPGRETTVPGDSAYVQHLADAIALTLNHQVRPLCSWIECGEAEGFPMLDVPRILHPPTWPNVRKSLDRDRIPEVLSTLDKLQLLPSNASQLKVAVFRWIESRSRESLADKFIELRIALEALYLQGERQGEFRFRVANHGAWDLGGNFDERVEYQRTLKNAYDNASVAMHTGKIGDPQVNLGILNKTQDLIRRGILKRLDDDGRIPNWPQVILGAADIPSEVS